MKKGLALLCAWALLASAACSGGPEKAPAGAAAADRSDVIAEADIDFNGDGAREKLYVRMTSGERKEEREPGPFTGVYWEGEFRLELAAEDGTPLHVLDLNPTFGGGPLLFAQNRAFDVAFADYNGDGYSDFSIGQYFSSNGFTYNLYSLTPEGIVLLHRDLFTADGEYSVLYPKAGPASFRNRYYDMVQGLTVETLWTWQGDRFVRTMCEGCGLAQKAAAAEAEGKAAAEAEANGEPSAAQWLPASQEQEELYARYAEEQDEELLRGLAPLDVFRFYVKASESKDLSTQYALYIKDPGYEVPSYKTFINDISRDQDALDRSGQIWGQLQAAGYGLREEIDGDHALIRMSNGSGKPEEDKGFQLVKNRGGIWKAAWMPMQ